MQKINFGWFRELDQVRTEVALFFVLGFDGHRQLQFRFGDDQIVLHDQRILGVIRVVPAHRDHLRLGEGLGLLHARWRHLQVVVLGDRGKGHRSRAFVSLLDGLFLLAG